MERFVKFEIELNDAELDTLERVVMYHWTDTAITYNIGQYLCEGDILRTAMSKLPDFFRNTLLESQKDAILHAIKQARRRLTHEK